jgi:hypothetical protein
MTKKMTRQEIDALRVNGWRVYNIESVKYDFLAVREENGETVTMHIKVK